MLNDETIKTLNSLSTEDKRIFITFYYLSKCAEKGLLESGTGQLTEEGFEAAEKLLSDGYVLSKSDLKKSLVEIVNEFENQALDPYIFALCAMEANIELSDEEKEIIKKERINGGWDSLDEDKE